MTYRLKALPGDSIPVPQLVFSKLGTANEANVRVALYLIATNITDPATIAKDLNLRGKQTAESALAFWAGAGLLEQVAVEAPPAEKPSVPPMTWQEIAAASRTDPMIAAIIECAQQSFGRQLSHSEMQKLVTLYTHEGFHPEVILLCTSYLAGKGKRTMSALSHELKAWQAEGVNDGEDADAYLQKLAAREQHEAFVCELLKLEPDALTLGAKKAIARWYEVFGYNDDMVTEAAVQAGAKKDVWYLNGILKSWQAKGLRTVHDVRGGGAAQSPAGRNVRVDRESPSGNDFLQAAAGRPRRLKNGDPAAQHSGTAQPETPSVPQADVPSPAAGDFLQSAMDRPRRLKRKD